MYLPTRLHCTSHNRFDAVILVQFLCRKRLCLFTVIIIDIFVILLSYDKLFFLYTSTGYHNCLSGWLYFIGCLAVSLVAGSSSVKVIDKSHTRMFIFIIVRTTLLLFIDLFVLLFRNFVSSKHSKKYTDVSINFSAHKYENTNYCWHSNIY